MKNILFNCTTNIVGGGAKNSYLFIKYLSSIQESDNWFYAVSNEVYKLMTEKDAVKKDQFFLFEISPSKSIKSRRRLKEIVTKNNISLVYTMAGPAYVDFKCTHILGISNPYVTHVNYKVLNLNIKEFLFTKLWVAYQAYWAKKGGFMVFQTFHSRDSWVKKSGFDKKNTHVIPNSFDERFIELYNNCSAYKVYEKAEVVFIPGNAFHHKNHMIICEVIAKHMETIKGLNIIFVTTIDENSIVYKKIYSKLKDLRALKHWDNLGNVNYNRIVEIYKMSDVILISSLLETFSATYLEAMITEKPLIAMKLSFAEEICKEHAIYAEPNNVDDIADKLVEAINQDDKNTGSLNYVKQNFVSSTERNKFILDLILTKK